MCSNIVAGILFVVSALGAFGAESIIISDPWVRAVPSVSSVTAVYMVIENRGDEDDKLIGVDTSASEYSEIHSTIIDENNVASMLKVHSQPIPSGESLELKPGGSHIMLRELNNPLKVGEQVEIDLLFEKSGTITIQAEVREDSL
jgi:copper(I)-binding protein